MRVATCGGVGRCAPPEKNGHLEGYLADEESIEAVRAVRMAAVKEGSVALTLWVQRSRGQEVPQETKGEAIQGTELPWRAFLSLQPRGGVSCGEAPQGCPHSPAREAVSRRGTPERVHEVQAPIPIACGALDNLKLRGLGPEDAARLPSVQGGLLNEDGEVGGEGVQRLRPNDAAPGLPR